MRSPIFGTAYTSRSANLAADRLINLYPEMVEIPGEGRAVGALYACPGLTLLGTLGGGPVTELHVMGDTLFATSGTTLYKLDTAFTATALGTIAAGFPSMIHNTTQLAVFAGGNGYLWTPGGGLVGITMPFSASGIIIAQQQDGFGLIHQPGTYLLFQSDLLDFSSWQALNVASASGDPDPIVALAEQHREIVVIKQFDTEFWYNAGQPNFAFQRLDGVYLNAGIAAPASLGISGETLVWVSQNLDGGGIIVQLRGHALTRISTHAIEDAIQKYPTIADAVGYTWQQDGHEFCAFSFPSGNTTWVYDATESVLSGKLLWHQHAAWDGAAFNRHWANCAVPFAGRIVVGDRRNGNLYALSLDAQTDAGTPRRWLRSWRALPQPSEAPVRFNSLRVDMETGTGIPGGQAASVALRWSDDGAHTWTAPTVANAGASTDTALRVMFRRLGSTRRDHGLDRVFEVSAVSPLPRAIVGADLDAA